MRYEDNYLQSPSDGLQGVEDPAQLSVAAIQQTL